LEDNYGVAGNKGEIRRDHHFLAENGRLQKTYWLPMREADLGGETRQKNLEKDFEVFTQAQAIDM